MQTVSQSFPLKDAFRSSYYAYMQRLRCVFEFMTMNLLISAKAFSEYLYNVNKPLAVAGAVGDAGSIHRVENT